MNITDTKTIKKFDYLKKYKNFFIILGLLSLFAAGAGFGQALYLPIALIFLFSLKYPEFWLVVSLTSGSYKLFFVGAPDAGIYFSWGILFILACSFILKLITSKTKPFKIIPKNFLLILGLIILLSGLSLFYSQSPLWGFQKFIRFALIVAPSMIITFYVISPEDKKHERLNIFLYVILFLSTLMALTALFNNSNTALGSNYLNLGRMTGMSIISLSSFYLFKNINNLSKSIFYMALILINFAGLLISASRGPLVATLSVIAILFLLKFRKSKNEKTEIKSKINKTKSTIIIVGIILSSFILIKEMPNITEKLFFRLSVANNEYNPNSNKLTRLLLAKKGFDLTVANPVFGAGLGGFGYYLTGQDSDSARGLYPHNIFLEFSSELGLVGLFLFIRLVGVPLYFLFNNVLKRSNSEPDYNVKLCILCLTVYMLINACISGSIDDNRFLFIFIALGWGIIGSEKIKEIICKKKPA